MTCNNSDYKITFSLVNQGAFALATHTWFGVFSHNGEWVDAVPISRLPHLVAFGAPIRFQEFDTMRVRIAHEWAMELADGQEANDAF